MIVLELLVTAARVSNVAARIKKALEARKRGA